jgi:hypothetical protein
MERTRHTPPPVIPPKPKILAGLNPPRFWKSRVFIPQFIDFMRAHFPERFVCALTRSLWAHVRATSLLLYFRRHAA